MYKRQPLRERGEDALLRFQHFAAGAAARHALAPRELPPGQRALLLRHPLSLIHI
nr:hypothetical protein [Pseudomonas sp. HS-2]